MPAAIVFAAGALSASAGIAAGGIIGGMMLAGGALSMIGAVTGNKYATRYGGYLSLAGGVAQIGSKMAESLAAETAKSAMQEGASSAATDALAQSAAPMAETAATDVAATAATDTAASQAGQALTQDAATGVLADSASAGSEGLIGSQLADSASGAASDLASFPTSVAEPVGGLETNWYKTLIPEGGGSTLSRVSNGSEIGAPWQEGFTNLSIGDGGAAQNALDMTKMNMPYAAESTGGSWLDKAESMAKGIEKYKTTANVASGIIGGALQQNSAKKAAKEAAEAQVAAQMKLEDERRKRYNASVANLALPRVTMTRKA